MINYRKWLLAAAVMVTLLLAVCKAQTPAPPTITWAGCGPSYNGSRVGASCGFEIALSAPNGIYSYTVQDWTWAHRKAANTTSTGLLLDLRDYRLGKWTAHINILGAPGVTTTPTATGFSAIYGIHPVIERGGWTIGGGFRGATGQAAPRLFNLSFGRMWGR